MNRAGSLGVGAALAVLVLFAIKVGLPEVYALMGDMEKQAATVVVVGAAQFIWGRVGPKTETKQ